MRYRAAVGVGEEAHSRQPHWCPWSKLVNVETGGHVPDPIVMAHALADSLDMAQWHVRAITVQIWASFQPHPLQRGSRN